MGRAGGSDGEEKVGFDSELILFTRKNACGGCASSHFILCPTLPPPSADVCYELFVPIIDEILFRRQYPFLCSNAFCHIFVLRTGNCKSDR